MGFFQFEESACVSLAAPLPSPKRVAPTSGHAITSFSCIDPLTALYNYCDDSGPTRIIQNNLPISESFIAAPKSLLPGEVPCSQVPGIRTWACFGWRGGGAGAVLYSIPESLKDFPKVTQLENRQPGSGGVQLLASSNHCDHMLVICSHSWQLFHAQQGSHLALPLTGSHTHTHTLPYQGQGSAQPGIQTGRVTLRNLSLAQQASRSLISFQFETQLLLMPDPSS